MELEGRVFRMWAVRRIDEHTQEIYYCGFGHKFYANCYAFEGVLVEVDVTINSGGTYWALYEIADEQLHMIYSNEPCFRVCFPYGPEDEEKRGRGKIVKCSVKEVQ